MEFKHLHSYTNESKKTLIDSESGKKFKDLNDNEIEFTSKRDYLKKVSNNEVGTTTNPKYAVVRELNKTGNADDKPHLRSVDYQDSFDHFVLENLPSNLTEQQIKDYQNVVIETLNEKYTYNDGETQYTHFGKKQIGTRVDTLPNGNKHIHFLINRMTTADITKYQEETLKDDYKNYVNFRESIDRALKFSNGKNEVLEQSFNIKNNYLKNQVEKRLNYNLTMAGLENISGLSYYAESNESNVKTPIYIKNDVLEIKTNGFSDEALNKAIEKIENQEYSTIDNNLLNKKIEANSNKKAELLAELERINREDKLLSSVENLKNDNIRNNTIIKELKENKEKLEETLNRFKEKEEEENKQKEDLINFLKDKNIDTDNIIIENALPSLKNILEQNINDYDNILEENKNLLTDKEKLVLENTTFKNDNETLKATNESIKKYNEAFKKSNEDLKETNNKLQQALIEMQENHKKSMALIEEKTKALEIKNKQLEEENNNIKAKFKEFKTTILKDISAKIKSITDKFTKLGDKLEVKEHKEEVKEIVKSTSDLVNQFKTKVNENNNYSQNQDKDRFKPK